LISPHPPWLSHSSAHKAARRATTWLLSQVWLQRFAYRQLFSVVLFKTLKRAFDGSLLRLDKLERTASLTHAGGETS